MAKVRTPLEAKYEVLSLGTILSFAAKSAIPTGWIECDGREIDRNEYAELYNAIGTTWGSGDGTNTFNLPDFRGLALRGTGTHGSEQDAAGSNYAGPSVGSYQTDQMQQITGKIATFDTTTPVATEGAFSAEARSNVGGRLSSTSESDSAQNLVFDSADSPNARTGDETRMANAGVPFAIKARHDDLTTSIYEAGSFDNRITAVEDKFTIDGNGAVDISADSGQDITHTVSDGGVHRFVGGPIAAEDISEVGGLPAFQCRAWVNFDGTTVDANNHCTISGSGNVDHVERLSTGRFRVVFLSPMPDSGYMVSGFVSKLNTQGRPRVVFRDSDTQDKTTDHVEVSVGQGNDGTLRNQEETGVSIFR